MQQPALIAFTCLEVAPRGPALVHPPHQSAWYDGVKYGEGVRNLFPVTEAKVSFGRRLRAHIGIARFDHSIKNLFVLPGMVVPLSVRPDLLNFHLIKAVITAFVSITLIACSNYVINEVLDAPFDRLHPKKRDRPAAQGLVHRGAAYVQWLLMMLAGILIASLLSWQFAVTAGILWIMGCVYNIPPVRAKDVAYVDVLTESVNNPLRMLLGWYAITTTLTPPLSLLLAYWMLGGYFMALKRYNELLEIGDNTVARSYRVIFQHYSLEGLLVSALFYASSSMLFLGAFMIRYRLELVLSFPFLAFTMATYLRLSFKKGSGVQNPEKLYRSPLLMCSFAGTALVMLLLLIIRIPMMDRIFVPTLP